MATNRQPAMTPLADNFIKQLESLKQSVIGFCDSAAVAISRTEPLRLQLNSADEFACAHSEWGAAAQALLAHACALGRTCKVMVDAIRGVSGSEIHESMGQACAPATTAIAICMICHCPCKCHCHCCELHERQAQVHEH